MSDAKKLRITNIDLKNSDVFNLKYETLEDEIWGDESSHAIGYFTVQVNSTLDFIKGIITRVLHTESAWGLSDVVLSNLKFVYQDPEKKATLWQENDLTKVVIGGEVVTNEIYSKKDLPTIKLGAIEQFIHKDKVDTAGYVNKVELEALERLLNEMAVGLAKSLNEAPKFVAEQLKLL